MQVLKEMSGPHIVFRLKHGESNESVGEAVLSEKGNEFRLHSISVKRGFRGKGLGKLIMNTILGEVQTKRITLCTGIINIAFFRQFGFEVTDVTESLISMEKSSLRG